MSDRENIIEVTELTFEAEVLQRSHTVPVVVDFWAPWCGPCRMLSPILEALADDDRFDFILAKVNVDESPALSMRYQVQGIPAVKAFRQGQIVAEFTGAQPAARVRQFIQKVAPGEQDAALAAAGSLLATRHWDKAAAAYREILTQRPQLPVALVNLAQALLATGEPCDALDHLDRCHDGPEYLRAQQLRPLAAFLCREQQRLATNANLDDDGPPVEMQLRQAARLWLRGNMAAAMDGLLDVLRQDKNYRQGEPKEALLAIFTLLGDDDPLTRSYRQELASILF